MSVYRVNTSAGGRWVWSNWLFYCKLPTWGNWLWRRLAKGPRVWR